MENEFKQSVVIGTLVMALFVAAYMIQTERKAAVADRQFSEWIERNQLSEFAHLFFEEGNDPSCINNFVNVYFELTIYSILMSTFSLTYFNN